MRIHLLRKIAALLLLLLTNISFAQRTSLEGLLDEAINLSQKEQVEELAEVLKSGSIALESEANTRGNDFKNNLLEQAKVLKSLAPLATQGSLKKETVTNTINTIKLLLGANHINNLLSEGKEGLLGNAVSLMTSLNLLKSGKAVLDNKGQEKLDKLVDSVADNVKKLDGKDTEAKVAATSAKRILGKIVDLVRETI
ncbi:hypothetical protein [Emticicia sp. 17c]|uniref:hypothetical protein n=1 Tax=Emticicia sp. 17c TaxID=3127704 RepID=UPI00301CA424